MTLARSIARAVHLRHIVIPLIGAYRQPEVAAKFARA
jgi:hypothetical protein